MTYGSFYILAAFAVFLGSVHGQDPEYQCYVAADGNTMSVDIMVEVTATSVQLIGIDVATATTGGCKSTSATAGTTPIHKLTITVDATTLPGSTTQSVPANPCYWSLDTGTGEVTYTVVVAQQTDIIQLTDTFWTAKCKVITAAADTWMQALGGGTVVGLASVTVTDRVEMSYSTEFELVKDSDSLAIADGDTVGLGDAFFMRAIYNYPAGIGKVITSVVSRSPRGDIGVMNTVLTAKLTTCVSAVVLQTSCMCACQYSNTVNELICDIEGNSFDCNDYFIIPTF